MLCVEEQTLLLITDNSNTNLTNRYSQARQIQTGKLIHYYR
jgi:hypothetical protein